MKKYAIKKILLYSWNALAILAILLSLMLPLNLKLFTSQKITSSIIAAFAIICTAMLLYLLRKYAVPMAKLKIDETHFIVYSEGPDEVDQKSEILLVSYTLNHLKHQDIGYLLLVRR